MVQYKKDGRPIKRAPIITPSSKPAMHEASRTTRRMINNKFSTLNYTNSSGSNNMRAKSHDVSDSTPIFAKISSCNSTIRPSNTYYRSSQRVPYFGKQMDNSNQAYKTITYRLFNMLSYIKEHCQILLRKPENYSNNQQISVLHESVIRTVCELKGDLECITEMERNSCSVLENKNGVSAKKLLTRMACRLFELEDVMNKPSIPTCSEILSRRKDMIDLIISLQKSVGYQLECELEAMRIREQKLCTLLRGLQCIEMQLRKMTSGIKKQCTCACVEVDECRRKMITPSVEATPSTEPQPASHPIPSKSLFTNCPKRKLCVPCNNDESLSSTPGAPSSTDVRHTAIAGSSKNVAHTAETPPLPTNVAHTAEAPQLPTCEPTCPQCPTKKSVSLYATTTTTTNSTPLCTPQNNEKQLTNNYQVTGMDIVYTRTRVISPESDSAITNSTPGEESIDKQIKCYIPCDSGSASDDQTAGGGEIKITGCAENFHLSDASPLKSTLYQVSNIWFESAKQLADSFNKC